MLLFGLWGHVVKLLDVALPDAQSEDLNPAFPQSRRDRPRVAAVGVAVGDQEDDLGGVGSGGTQDLLSEKKKKQNICITFFCLILEANKYRIFQTIGMSYNAKFLKY